MEVEVASTSVGSSSTPHTHPPLLGCACVLPISYLCVCIIGVVSYYDTYVPIYLAVGTGDPRLSVLPNARENGPWVTYVCSAWEGRGGEGRGGRCLDVTLECTCIFRWMMDDG